MRICGIVSEYNPFHKGHAYQIEQAKSLLGEDSAVICCMSGDFVQRGDAAVLPKHLRAKGAILDGADLVLELPSPYALRSAEGFAHSAVRILLGTGVLTDLSFGAEDADSELLKETASLLLEHQTVQDTLTHLKTGISYAAARERALYARVKEKAQILQKPNNILAIEYFKALIRQEASVGILPITRTGTGHDQGADGEYASASYIRELLRDGKFDEALPYLTPGSRAVLQDAVATGQALLDQTRLENAMLSTLVRLTADDLAVLPDANEGLDNRLLDAIRRGRTIEEICTHAKTKRYALSRIRRMLFCAYLGITRQEACSDPAYARVLAFNDKGREVLKLARKQATLPLITKPAHAYDLGGNARAIFEQEALACDLYHLALPCWKAISWGADWRQDAIYVK